MSSSSSNERLAGMGLSLPQITMINSRSNIKTKTLKSSRKQAESGEGGGIQSLKEWNHTRCHLHLPTFPEALRRLHGVGWLKVFGGKFQKGGSPEQGGPNLCINPT